MKTRIRPSDIFLINSLILGNQATSSGGGCYVTGSLLDLLNCTVSGNEIVEFIGGGLRAQNMGEITVSNSIICGNFAASLEGHEIGIILDSTVTPVFTNVPQEPVTDIFVGTNTFLLPNPLESGGNLDSNPLFVAEGMLDNNGTIDILSDDTWIDGDYHLHQFLPVQQRKHGSCSRNCQ